MEDKDNSQVSILNSTGMEESFAEIRKTKRRKIVKRRCRNSVLILASHQRGEIWMTMDYMGLGFRTRI